MGRLRISRLCVRCSSSGSDLAVDLYNLARTLPAGQSGDGTSAPQRQILRGRSNTRYLRDVNLVDRLLQILY